MSNQPFEPYQPEKMVVCEISRREALMLQKIRKHSFGKFTIHKQNNLIIRIELIDSELLKEDAEITIPIVDR